MDSVQQLKDSKSRTDDYPLNCFQTGHFPYDLEQYRKELRDQHKKYFNPSPERRKIKFWNLRDTSHGP